MNNNKFTLKDVARATFKYSMPHLLYSIPALILSFIVISFIIDYADNSYKETMASFRQRSIHYYHESGKITLTRIITKALPTIMLFGGWFFFIELWNNSHPDRESEIKNIPETIKVILDITGGLYIFTVLLLEISFII